MKLQYEPDDVLGNVGPYDLVSKPGSDRIFVVDSRLNGEVADEVEEGFNTALIAASRQYNFDHLLGLY